MRALATFTLLGLAACAGSTDGTTTGTPEGRGRLQVFVEAEDSIPEGLTPGTSDENIADGWTVTYDKFLIAIGDVQVSRSSGGDALSESAVHIVDLTSLPTTGVVIADFSDVAATRWDRFGFSIPRASSSATKAAQVSQADFDAMVAGGYSLWVEGRISNPAGMRCPHGTNCTSATQPIQFSFQLAKGTRFSDCAAPDSAAGVAVPSGGTAQAKPTIHGDHWFFTNITQGAETTERRAQWLADSDLDGNNVVTLEELQQVQAAEVFKVSSGYNLSGAIIPVNTAWDYVEAQAHTLGDFQGEGECPTRAILN